ncbi:MAG: hypothetical protein CVV61_07260 [Tenericutes bacterium HGW-Tenericutes-6]|jgi:hypothetical protein|nr:MAG: hypothetical protein CVV61_07260 [Tenericutes bacterium HGW-Tenericutes-6]
MKVNPDQTRWLQERMDMEKEKMKVKQQGILKDGSSRFKEDGLMAKIILWTLWLGLVVLVIFVLFIW